MTAQQDIDAATAVLTQIQSTIQAADAQLATDFTAIQAEIASLQGQGVNTSALDAAVAAAQSTASGLAPAVAQITSLEPPAAAPAVDGVSPASGTVNGGDTVTVSGSGFTGATAVEVGTQQAESFEVASDTELTFVTPATVAGTYDVTVTTPAGTSAASAADQFTTS